MAAQQHVVTADDGVALVGELVAPGSERPAPAALILSGSGPLDRNANMPEHVLDVGNTLATALAARGVASLRLDKRGVGESGGDFLSMGFVRETADAAAALDSLRAVAGVDPERVTLIGHSGRRDDRDQAREQGHAARRSRFAQRVGHARRGGHARLTHVLRTHDGRAGLDTYPAQLEKQMDPELVERITTWVKAR